MTALDAGVRLRRVSLSDLESLLAIKRALPMPRAAGTRTGGFLIGADPSGYAALLRLGQGWLLEVEAQPAGFALTLPDAGLRASPLWGRRDTIEWASDVDPAAFLADRIGYFDQLAVLPHVRWRYWGAALALRALTELIVEQEHPLVLTTTVVEPIENAAALSYLSRVGARPVGRVVERHPEAGLFVSALHAIEARRCRALLAELERAARPATRRVLELAG